MVLFLKKPLTEIITVLATSMAKDFDFRTRMRLHNGLDPIVEAISQSLFLSCTFTPRLYDVPLQLVL